MLLYCQRVNLFSRNMLLKHMNSKKELICPSEGGFLGSNALHSKSEVILMGSVYPGGGWVAITFGIEIVAFAK